MSDTSFSWEEPESTDCYRNCSREPKELLANPDVGGIGVLIGFVATAWLVVILVIFRYFLAFDPTADPFTNSTPYRRYDRGRIAKPNTVDVQAVRIFLSLRKRLGHHSLWNTALKKILLTLCDVQLLTGFGLLCTSFISLTCYMSAYHWQIISYLAWFSNLTHAACLTALREHMYHHQMERNLRMTLMVILLAGLITAIVPTGYFNWNFDYTLDEQGTISVPASNARCYFSQKSIDIAWEYHACGPGNHDVNEYHCFGPLDDRGNRGKATTPQTTAAYESSMLSIALLTLSFSSRSMKMFRTFSKIARDTIRQKIGDLAVSGLTATATGFRSFESNPLQRRLLAVLRPLDLMIALYLVAKLYLEVLSSELSDLFWLFVSSVWGTVRLIMARKSADVDGAEDKWGFGQVLSVFLLLGPITTVSVAIFATFRRQRQLRSQTEDRDSIRQLLAFLAAHQAGLAPTHRASTDMLNHVSSILQDIESELRTRSPPMSQGFMETELETIRLDDLQQSPENAAGTDADAPLNPAPPSPIRSETSGGIVPALNQDTLREIEYIDMRGSLAFRFSQSQWMTIVIWFCCFQFVTVVILIFLFLVWGPYVSPDLGWPSFMFKSTALTVCFVQPLNCFIAVVLGLYIPDKHASKLQLTVFGILLYIFLMSWNIFAAFPMTSYYFKWYYALGPLTIIVVQFMYLGFR